MEVILSQDVQKLGKVGDIVKVKDGHARNFLIPRKLAFAATAANLKRIEIQKTKRVQEDQKLKGEAEQLAAKLNKVSCTVSVEVNDLEKLYGTVSEADIAKALEDEGFTVDKKDIVLDKAIEELGIFDVSVKLDQGVTAKVRVWVTKK